MHEDERGQQRPFFFGIFVVVLCSAEEWVVREPQEWDEVTFTDHGVPLLLSM